KDDLRKAYEKCNDISQESRALIDSFLKEGSDKDYELNLSMYGKAAKLEKHKDAKLAWLLEKYYYRSQESVGCSSSHADLYLTEKELYQLHLDEEALRETLEEQAMDAKAREEKIRQKQADDDEFFLTFGRMDPNFTNENDPWEYNLDIDDSDLNITPVLRSSSSTRVEPSPYTPTPLRIIPGPAVRIIPGPAGLVQRAKKLKENVFILDPDGVLMSTQEYMQKVIEDVGEDSDFNSGAWINATNYALSTGGTVTGCLGDINNFLKKGKLKQVVAIVKSCSSNCLGDLNVTMKDLSGTVRGTLHHKLLDVGTYGKDIDVGAVMILANVSVFTLKPSEHYLNITKKNVVKVFRKDTVSSA
ncbi:transposase, MuDR, MULE transposase domain protein, partial [Tanacetum coccineum]